MHVSKTVEPSIPSPILDESVSKGIPIKPSLKETKKSKLLKSAQSLVKKVQKI